MKKITKLVIMLCLTLSGALCFANGATRPENEKREGTPITTIAKAQYGGTDKSGSISIYLDGHYLTVSFTENLGQVAIEITTAPEVPCPASNEKVL